jgi:hypothetical protein
MANLHCTCTGSRGEIRDGIMIDDSLQLGKNQANLDDLEKGVSQIPFCLKIKTPCPAPLHPKPFIFAGCINS